MKLANHGERERTAPVDYFRHTAPRADQGFEILPGKVHLLHPELDGLYGIRWVNRVML
jgi:hypothetical protein